MMNFQTYYLRKCSTSIVIGSVLLALCLQPALARKSVKPADTKTGEAFDLKIDEKIVLSRTAIQVKLIKVEDSRCPRNVACVWEGNAAVTVDLTYRGRDKRTVILNTHKSPTMPAEFTYHGYKLSLAGVNPYPGTMEPGKAVGKVVALKATRV